MRHGLHCGNPSGRGHLEDTWTPAEKARMLLRLLLTPALAYIPKNRIFAASPATVASVWSRAAWRGMCEGKGWGHRDQPPHVVDVWAAAWG